MLNNTLVKLFEVSGCFPFKAHYCYGKGTDYWVVGRSPETGDFYAHPVGADRFIAAAFPPLNADWVLADPPKAKPPATKRVYQALMQDDGGAFVIPDYLFSSELEAVKKYSFNKFVRLLDPGFEVPA